MTTNYTDSDPLLQPEIKSSIFNNLPDQFTKYDTMTYNPLDFYTASGEFNLALFNKTFREEQIRRIEFYRKYEEDRLRRLEEEENKVVKFQDLSVGQHLINMKNTIFDITSDIIAGKPISPKLFTKNNRMFYLGLILLIIFIIYLTLNNFIHN